MLSRTRRVIFTSASLKHGCFTGRLGTSQHAFLASDTVGYSRTAFEASAALKRERFTAPGHIYKINISIYRWASGTSLTSLITPEEDDDYISPIGAPRPPRRYAHDMRFHCNIRPLPPGAPHDYAFAYWAAALASARAKRHMSSTT